jgi:hypothetical protein
MRGGDLKPEGGVDRDVPIAIHLCPLCGFKKSRVGKLCGVR